MSEPLATTPPQPTISPRTAQDLRTRNDSLQAQLQSAVEQLQQLSTEATPMPVDEGSLSEAQLQQLRDHHSAVEKPVLPAISHEMAGMLAVNVDTPNALTQSANTGDLVPVIVADPPPGPDAVSLP